MAEQERPEGRRRREREEASSLGGPDQVLVWLLLPGGILVGWAGADFTGQERPGSVGPRDLPASASFRLHYPVMLHQVPMTAEGGSIGVAQLYTALQVDGLQVNRAAVIAVEVLDREGDVARLHAQAWRQRTGSGLLLARSGGRLAH